MRVRNAVLCKEPGKGGWLSLKNNVFVFPALTVTQGHAWVCSAPCLLTRCLTWHQHRRVQHLPQPFTITSSSCTTRAGRASHKSMSGASVNEKCTFPFQFLPHRLAGGLCASRQHPGSLHGPLHRSDVAGKSLWSCGRALQCFGG